VNPPLIRAGLRARLTRWRDALIGAGLAAGGVALFGRAALSGAPVPLVLLAVSLTLGVWLARDGWLRARLEGDTRLGGGGPGVASVREGEIDYFGPFSGGVVDLDALESVVLSVRPGGAVWLLRPARRRWRSRPPPRAPTRCSTPSPPCPVLTAPASPARSTPRSALT